MMAFQGAHRMGKQEIAILSLPEHPAKHIYWIVYNHDMIGYVSDLIEKLRGKEFCSNVTVVAKGEPTKNRTSGAVYFDPTLLDLLGNGN